MKRKWKFAFGLAVLNDMVDILGIGSVPVIGTVLDLITSALLWRTLGTSYTIPTVLEFIPGVNILPIYTTLVTLRYYKVEYEPKPGKE